MLAATGSWEPACPAKQIRTFLTGGGLTRLSGGRFAVTGTAVVLDMSPVFSLTLGRMTRIEQSLRAALAEYERDLISAGKAPDTVHTYVDRAERFIKYLVGTYKP